MNGQPILQLPPITVEKEVVVLSPDEASFYTALWGVAKGKFKKMDKEGTVQSNYIHVLEMLLRVRQSCDHPYLVLIAPQVMLISDIAPISSKRDKSNLDVVALNQEFLNTACPPSDKAEKNIAQMEATLLGSDEMDNCVVCTDETDDSYIVTGCAHRFCKTV